MSLSPYVEKPFNSKVIKSFVLELRSHKCFCVSGFLCYLYMSMNILCTLYVFMDGYVTDLQKAKLIVFYPYTHNRPQTNLKGTPAPKCNTVQLPPNPDNKINKTINSWLFIWNVLHPNLMKAYKSCALTTEKRTRAHTHTHTHTHRQTDRHTHTHTHTHICIYIYILRSV